MTRSELVTASTMKLHLSALLTSPIAGRAIAKATRNQIPNHGIRFDTSWPEFTPTVKAQMFWGSYEGAEIRMIRRHLRDARTVVELGSSLGVTTAHIAAAVQPGGRIVCVEANPNLVDGLRRRTCARARDIRVDIDNLAVSSRGEPAALMIVGTTYGSRLDDGTGRSDRAVTVRTASLRHILERHSVDQYDLVSDIEGAEASFLLDDPGALAGCRRAVLELHHTTHDGRRLSPFDLMDAAEAAGLHVVEQHGPVVALARA